MKCVRLITFQSQQWRWLDERIPKIPKSDEKAQMTIMGKLALGFVVCNLPRCHWCAWKGWDDRVVEVGWGGPGTGGGARNLTSWKPGSQIKNPRLKRLRGSAFRQTSRRHVARVVVVAVLTKRIFDFPLMLANVQTFQMALVRIQRYAARREQGIGDGWRWTRADQGG